LNRQNGKILGILVGGGPAPGINGVIRAVTIHAINSGYRVLGLNDGFYWLVQGDSSHHTELTIDQVSRIHSRGGSILRTSRVNPTTSSERLQATVEALAELKIDCLVTVGGDDTASSAAKVQAASGHRFAVAHVPKTIDNDLPLPGHLPTFGYETARHVGVAIAQAIIEDAQTTNRWFFLVSMGRKAGHLALGIGRASGATLTVIGEEFRDRTTTLDSVADILEGAIIKRKAMGRGFGVAILAEGILERLDPEELRKRADIERDAHGNIRYGEIEFGRMLRVEVRRRLRERGLEGTPLVDKDIGYELRCADPIPFDLEYTQDLGYAAVRYLESGGRGAIVAIERGRMIPLPFDSILDPVTGRARIRQVDIDSDSYRVARHYMIRLERGDFEDPNEVQRLAMAAKLPVEEFEARFRYLTEDPPVRDTGEGGARRSG